MTSRATRCDVLARMTVAMSNWPDDMPSEAVNFETMGWGLTFETAPRCDDQSCEVCH